MYITEVSIRRPVVAWVLSLILIVFGLFVYSEVPVRELPDGLQPPVVQVKVDYKSASAPIIDQEIRRAGHFEFKRKFREGGRGQNRLWKRILTLASFFSVR